MKKIFLLAIVACLAVQASAQSGRIRITFYGFKCIRETWDDILGMDGRGDEVFFRFAISRADARGTVKQNFSRITDVYGDKSGAFTNRIKAGTESPTGGIRAGDQVNANLLLGEFDLNDGDITTIIPTAWEQDPIADNSNSFASTVDGFVASLNQRIAPIMIGVHALTGDLAGALFYGASLGLTATRPAGDQGELGRAGTRPIGMQKNGDFIPNVFTINTANLVTLCNSNYGFGNGVFAVNYDEVALGNSRDHGNYVLLIKLEFTGRSNPVVPPPPAPAATTSAPPPPPRTNVPVVSTPAPAAATSLNTSIHRTPASGILPAPPSPAPNSTYTLPTDWAAVTWVGTKDGQFFAMRFVPPTAWILKDTSPGTVEAAGVCKVTNNVLTITYSTDKGQFTMTTTYYNTSTGVLSGTWQKTGDPNQQGLWLATRKK